MSGIHHVTAISGDLGRTVAFYRDMLGLRLVKQTVNHDDPGTWHLYFADEQGAPGTVITFFSSPPGSIGRPGTGEVAQTTFSVPETSIGFWRARLARHRVVVAEPVQHFGETVLCFRDPDGLRLALVGVAGAGSLDGRPAPDLPGEHSLRGIRGVTLRVTHASDSAAQLEQVLTQVLGFRKRGPDGDLIRFSTGDNDTAPAIGGVVDLEAVDTATPSRMGIGSVHHVAFRASDDAEQARMRDALATSFGLRPTETVDRVYFRSIYLREPTGTIFEIATDAPGFAVDEPANDLGGSLVLPPWLEPHRDSIARALPAWERA